MNEAILKNVRVVLVEPLKSGNLGSVARAMKNCGLSELVLVRPVATINETARAMANKALTLLQGARVVTSLEEALEGCFYAVGFTACREKRSSMLRNYYDALPEFMAAATQSKVAFVFGREDFGLDKESMDRCRHMVMIPTHPGYESLNLAQAVLLAGHALMVAAGEFTLDKYTPYRMQEGEALFEHREGFYNDLKNVLAQVGFFSDELAEPATMRKFRQIFEKARLQYKEIQILRGLCRQILWASQARAVLEEHGNHDFDDPRSP